MKSLYLIMNPTSGTRQANRLLADMVAVFSRSGFLCTVYMTAARGDASRFAALYGSQADLIVACGGDGTLNEVISGLLSAGHRTPLGYIPAGSTNDFANGLGIPANIIQACEAIVAGTPKPLDMGRFGEDRYFCYTASFGAFTSVSYSTPQNVKNVLGHIAYILEGVRSLAEIRPIHMRIRADDNVYEGDYLFGSVCNSTSLGGVLKLEKDQVHVNDGQFESLLIPFPADLLALNRVISALSARHYEDPSLIFLRASSFAFEGCPDLHWTLDGEEASGADPLMIRNLFGAVHFIY